MIHIVSNAAEAQAAVNEAADGDLIRFMGVISSAVLPVFENELGLRGARQSLCRTDRIGL